MGREGEGAGDCACHCRGPGWAGAGCVCCQDQPAKVRQEHTVGSYVWSHDCAHCSVAEGDCPLNTVKFLCYY